MLQKTFGGLINQANVSDSLTFYPRRIDPIPAGMAPTQKPPRELLLGP